MSFGDFFDIQYEVDADDNVYPEIYSEFEKGIDNDKKKKKGIDGKIEGVEDDRKVEDMEDDGTPLKK